MTTELIIFKTALVVFAAGIAAASVIRILTTDDKFGGSCGVLISAAIFGIAIFT